MLRSFQHEFLQRIQDIARGASHDRDLYCAITPGGGKSALPLIATSDKPEETKVAIDAFKGRTKPHADVLVTVGIAYEGLDVPEITHIACLTRYRSKPWLEQCFARACRSYHNTQTGAFKQAGYIFAPDDRLLAEVVDAIKSEQMLSIREEELGDPANPGSGNGGAPPEPGYIIPKQSQATESRAYDLQHGITRAETARIAIVMQRHGIRGISPLQLKRVLDDLDRGVPETYPATEPQRPLTPSEEEAQYRQSINEYTKKVDAAYFAGEFGRTNSELRRRGWAARETLPLEQLHQLWRYLQQQFPLAPLGDEPLAQEG